MCSSTSFSMNRKKSSCSLHESTVATMTKSLTHTVDLAWSPAKSHKFQFYSLFPQWSMYKYRKLDYYICAFNINIRWSIHCSFSKYTKTANNFSPQFPHVQCTISYTWEAGSIVIVVFYEALGANRELTLKLIAPIIICTYSIFKPLQNFLKIVWTLEEYIRKHCGCWIPRYTLT